MLNIFLMKFIRLRPAFCESSGATPDSALVCAKTDEPGASLRQNVFTFDFAWPGEAEHKSIQRRRKAKREVPPYLGGTKQFSEDGSYTGTTPLSAGRGSIVRRLMLLFLAAAVLTGLAGCVRFTERDYELQEKAYEKQRQQQEEKDKDSLLFRW